MTSTEEQRIALQERWKRLQIRQKTSVPSRKCDILRSLMAQVEHARAIDALDADSAYELMGQYMETYACVVDAPLENGGVNNYAEGALAYASAGRNESKAWTSSFNKESIMQLECVKTFIKETKLARNVSFTDDNDRILHLNPTLSSTTSSTKALPVATSGTKKILESSMPRNTLEDSSRSCPANVHPQGQQRNNNYTFKATGHATSSSSLWDSKQAQSKSIQPELPGPLNSGPSIGGHNQRHLFKSSSENPSGEMSGWGSGLKKDFWSLGGGQRHGESGPADDLIGRDMDGAGQKQRSVQYPNNTVQPKPYAKFAPNKPFPPYRKPQKRHCPDEDDEMEDEPFNPNAGAFKTAAEQLAINNQKKHGGASRTGGGGFGNVAQGSANMSAYGNQKRSLGTRRGPSSKFVPPVIRDENDDGGTLVRKSKSNKNSSDPEEPVDERLKNIDPKMIELVSNEIMDHGLDVTWEDIAGLEFAKKTITEIVVWPMLRPDIFTGLRGPPKGLLLFGPPGTGKTLIGKCIASQSKSTFFSISASSLTSKWVGEGEKMVRALFAVARVHQPSVIFIDEIDSLLSQRTDGEHEASRRIKTEFLVQLDGATTGTDDRILVVGATNRPQEIDEAARRRFVKRLYIPLPEEAARKQIVVNLMATQPNQLADEEIDNVCRETLGYSGADMANLCKEAALGPIRSISMEDIENITAEQVRPIVHADFQEAVIHVRPSVSEKDLDVYLEWNRQYGSWGK